MTLQPHLRLRGVRAIIVHAIDHAALPFYLRYGFHSFHAPQDLTLFLPIEEVTAAL